MYESTVANITKQAERLDLPEYIELIEALVHNLKEKNAISRNQALDWQGRYGLGKGVWADEDAQGYVNRLGEV